jgi:hypothetical protein
VKPDPAPSAALKAQVAQDQRAAAEAGRLRDGVVTTILGDLTSHQLRVLADLSEAYSDGSMRVTAEQNLLFRWVKGSGPRRAAHAARRGRASASPAPTPWPTWSAAPAPNRAASR